MRSEFHILKCSKINFILLRAPTHAQHRISMFTIHAHFEKVPIKKDEHNIKSNSMPPVHIRNPFDF